MSFETRSRASSAPSKIGRTCVTIFWSSGDEKDGTRTAVMDGHLLNRCVEGVSLLVQPNQGLQAANQGRGRISRRVLDVNSKFASIIRRLAASPVTCPRGL